jgi:hypothetical protein
MQVKPFSTGLNAGNHLAAVPDGQPKFVQEPM